MEKKDYNLTNKLLINRLQNMPVNSDEYKQAQTDLVVFNQPLITRFLMNKIVSENDREDAQQVCRMSLLKAAATYDLNGTNKYSTYAMNTMMFDFAKFSKDYDNNPSGYYTASKILYKAKKRLEEKGIEEPSIEEISREMKADKFTVESIINMKGMVSTETPITLNGEDGGITVLDSLTSEDNVLESTINMENIEEVRKAISFLSKENRFIIESRMLGSLKNDEVCRVLGVSRQTVINKLKDAQNELKAILSTGWKFNAHSLKQTLEKSYEEYIEKNGLEPNIEELLENKNITYDRLYDVFKLNKIKNMQEVAPKIYKGEEIVNIKANKVVKNISDSASRLLIHKFILSKDMNHYAKKNNMSNNALNRSIIGTLQTLKNNNDAIYNSLITKHNM